MTIRAHKQAILARLREDALLTDRTYEGIVQDRPEFYCTVYADSGYREQARLTGPQTRATFSYTVHSVGKSPDQAQAVAEHVFSQLLGFTPTVEGFSCRRVRHSVSRPVAMDRDSTPPLWYCVDVFDLTSEPLA